MSADDLTEIEEVRQKAMQLGIVLPEARDLPPVIGCFGHQLPPSFVWFCRHYPQQPDFPHDERRLPVGRLSPLGNPSDLKRHNERVREWEPQWPSHWVSFWHGTDGDYCFSYDKDEHPWVVYWDSNAPDQFRPQQFEDRYTHADFADWLAR